MKSNLRASSITYANFKHHLDEYTDHVPTKLQALENLRLQEVPETLEQRRKAGDAFLEKPEVTGLVEWKLKHGTYRPTLAALVASNPPSAILTSTRTAFTTYSTNPDTSGNTKALNALTTLKGVGPATASLLLSCYDPTHIPFFSDELYRYLHWEEGSRGKGWDRKIGYTLKEYRALCDRLQILRLRLEHESGEEVKAVDIEKMAYALAKSEQQAEGLGEPKGEGEGDGEDVQPTSSKKRSKDKDAGEVQPPSSKKRSKVEDIKEMQPAPSKKRSKIQDTKEVQPPASKKLKKSSRPLR